MEEQLLPRFSGIWRDWGFDAPTRTERLPEALTALHAWGQEHGQGGAPALRVCQVLALDAERPGVLTRASTRLVLDVVDSVWPLFDNLHLLQAMIVAACPTPALGELVPVSAQLGRTKHVASIQRWLTKRNSRASQSPGAEGVAASLQWLWDNRESAVTSNSYGPHLASFLAGISASSDLTVESREFAGGAIAKVRECAERNAPWSDLVVPLVESIESVWAGTRPGFGSPRARRAFWALLKSGGANWNWATASQYVLPEMYALAALVRRDGASNDLLWWGQARYCHTLQQPYRKLTSEPLQALWWAAREVAERAEALPFAPTAAYLVNTLEAMGLDVGEKRPARAWLEALRAALESLPAEHSRTVQVAEPLRQLAEEDATALPVTWVRLRSPGTDPLTAVALPLDQTIDLGDLATWVLGEVLLERRLTHAG